MYDFDNNTNQQLSAEIMRQIHVIELKKPTMIYTAAHIDKLLAQLNDVLIKHCGIYPYNKKDMSFVAKQYSLYITSGNEESNKNLIYGAISSFRRLTKHRPHILMCDTNDIPLLNYLNQLKLNNDADIEVLPNNVQGNAVTKIIEKAIRPNQTCMIIINCANTIFGSINNVSKIGELAHQHKIPLHVNCTYLFGNAKINPYENNMDSFFMDFSNIGGIKSFGILGIKKNLLDGYQLDKAVVEFSPTIDHTKIDPVSLQIAINTINAIYNAKKTRLAKQKKIRAALLKLLRKHFNVATLLDWLKGTDNFVAGKRSFIVLYAGDDSNLICQNIITLVPLGLNEREKAKFAELANYDYVDKAVIANYKTMFADIFKKANKNIINLDTMYTLSWGDKINMAQVASYINGIKKIFIE